MKLLPVSELTDQESEFVHLIATEGLAPPAAAKRVGLSHMSGYNWLKKPKIAEAINDTLAHNKQRIRLKASLLIDKSFARIEDAMNNPNVTPTMLKAAGMALMYASGQEREAGEGGGGNLTVVVNTTTGSDVLAQQQARAQRTREAAIEASYEVPGEE